MSDDLTAFEILDETLPQLYGLGNPGCDPVDISDNSGVWVSARIDFDVIQFLMLEVRKPYRFPPGGIDKNTVVDHLFVSLEPYGTRVVEWDNHPHEFFDASEGMEPYQRFVEWVGGMFHTMLRRERGVDYEQKET